MRLTERTLQRAASAVSWAVEAPDDHLSDQAVLSRRETLRHSFGGLPLPALWGYNLCLYRAMVAVTYLA